jgi:hypothetical protein
MQQAKINISERQYQNNNQTKLLPYLSSLSAPLSSLPEFSGKKQDVEEVVLVNPEREGRRRWRRTWDLRIRVWRRWEGGEGRGPPKLGFEDGGDEEAQKLGFEEEGGEEEIQN